MGAICLGRRVLVYAGCAKPVEGVRRGAVHWADAIIAVLCFTIINTHEKAAQEHLAQILRLQMDTLRKQIDAEKKHRADMAILRHDMRHEAGVIAELFRAGKDAQAEAVYAQWQASLARAEPEPISR